MSRRFTRGIALCLSVLAICGGVPQRARAAVVSAAELLDSRQEYSADFSLRTSAQGGFRGRVIHAQGRERREFAAMGGPQVLLLRRDLDEAVMMWPERHFYLSTSFSQASSLIGGFESVMLDRRKEGAETVDGEACTRYAVTGSSMQGGSFRGKMWFTGDGILMKAMGTVQFQGKETSLETSLSHLQRTKADPSVFVRPSDYKGMPLDLSSFGLGGK
ncbi:MAG TPA: hypothetical protein VM661_09300 [Candidatus Sulfotelmatobacter sp.]|nr:hypothetical protein [Candidatus Sulfotelmatobacter sp.]